jgi:prevent-host-death family protein
MRASWRLQDAKARFSEVVRRARADGPQRVTVHGHDAVVIVDASTFDRSQVRRTGERLVETMASAPLADVEFERTGATGPVRAVEL